MVILSGTLKPWNSISLIIPTTVLSAGPSMDAPSSAMIFHPFLEPRALLMLNDTSVLTGVMQRSGLVFLEFTAELFLDRDLSLAARKLAARRISLLKLFALLSAGLMTCSESSGEPCGTGECVHRGEGEREGDRGLRSKGLGDLECVGEQPGVESGDSSAMFQNSRRMSGLGESGVVGRPRLGGVMLVLGGVSLLGGVRESLLPRRPALSLLSPSSGTLGFLSVADKRLFWFLSAVRKLSSLCRAEAATASESLILRTEAAVSLS